MTNGKRHLVAYFSMEIAVHPDIPTYSGGLGVLAGDHLRSAADLEIPMIGVTLLYRHGYLRQEIDSDGQQRERPVDWNVAEHLVESPERITVSIDGEHVLVRAWKYEVVGESGFIIPVYFLDTDLPENREQDRRLTHWLYGGDDYHRLCQEVLLGIGGVRLLRVKGFRNIDRFHMNEGHAALLGLELLVEESRMAFRRSRPTIDQIESVREQCLFTTHTPVAAGHDRFPAELARRVLANHPAQQLPGFDNIIGGNNELNMTSLAMNLSRSINGVAQRHAEVSRRMFPQRQVGWITNGVHIATWSAPPMQELYDSYMPGWREHPAALRNAFQITDEEIDSARRRSKEALLAHVRQVTGVALDPEVLTIGFARRFTAYKRPTLLLHDLDRLNDIAEEGGDVQIVYAGKAHPHDQDGKALIREVHQVRKRLGPRLQCVFLPNYDMHSGLLITSGVDVWLNTPQPPLEASGTSGMKAAVNGVPSLSVVDGWWVEGWQEGITGWSIGEDGFIGGQPRSQEDDVAALYDKLSESVLPRFYRDPRGFRDMVRQTIAINGSFFNTHRMLMEYAVKAYYHEH